MAIDTAAKRRNAAQVGCPLPVSVLPSGSIAVFERYQVSWSYDSTSVPVVMGRGTVQISADPQTSAGLTAVASFIVEISAN